MLCTMSIRTNNLIENFLWLMIYKVFNGRGDGIDKLIDMKLFKYVTFAHY